MLGYCAVAFPFTSEVIESGSTLPLSALLSSLTSSNNFSISGATINLFVISPRTVKRFLVESMWTACCRNDAGVAADTLIQISAYNNLREKV